jgi:solute:Na+ symporter, SSS family
VAFVIVALATQKKHPGTERHGVIEYVPPEQDVVAGEDLKGYTSPSGLKFA